MAHADDNSMSLFGGESYTYFKDAIANKAPSTVLTFRTTHPKGLSEHEMQAVSSESPVWQLPAESATSALASTDEATVVARTPTRLSDRDFQALSSVSPMWHQSPQPAPSALASTNVATMLAKIVGK
jgi:hypothetical protein